MAINYIKQSQLYFIGSFALLIFVGMLLLLSPLVTYTPNPELPGMAEYVYEPVDALFTATSAVCVTGLTVIPISGFNFFGQLVILMLIQLGGIGIMTLSVAIIMFISGGRMDYGETRMMASLNENFSLRRTEGLIRVVLRIVFAVEGVGALLLWGSFWLIEGRGFWMSLYYGVFHAVSAFCNAGLSLFDTNMCEVSWLTKLVISFLTIAGGLGIYVYYDLALRRNSNKSLHVHTRIVLLATMVLLIGGTLGFWAFEWQSSDVQIGWIDAFFQAVAARTAGFNSVDLTGMSPASQTMMVILMLIGGAPGSMAGGIKLVAVTVAAMAIVNTFKGNNRVLIMRREVPMNAVLKSFTIICCFLILTTLGGLALTLHSEASFGETYFEAVSALCTVGWSLGFSNHSMYMADKLILVCFMFVGRIGLFTFFLFLMEREKSSRLKYPEEKMIIG